MTARAYYVEGVELVNCGGESCSACDRPAVGTTIRGHLICAAHAGMAAVMADEYAAEVEASRERNREQNAIDLARIREKMIVPETVNGDRQRGRNGGKARRSNADTSRPPSPRRGYDRSWYLANREKKIASVKARLERLRGGAA